MLDAVLSHSLEQTWPSRLNLTQNNVMSLVGHGIVAVGCAMAIVCTRSIEAIGFVQWKFGITRPFLTTCSVEATLGAPCKLILLGRYSWSGGKRTLLQDQHVEGIWDSKVARRRRH